MFQDICILLHPCKNGGDLSLGNLKQTQVGAGALEVQSAKFLVQSWGIHGPAELFKKGVLKGAGTVPATEGKWNS